MKKTLLALACGFGTLIACSNSSNSSDICAAYYSAVQACPIPDGGLTPNDGGGPTQATCETALSSSSCTDAPDQAAIPGVTACIKAIPTCTNASTFGAALQACAINADAGVLLISQACLTAANL